MYKVNAPVSVIIPCYRCIQTIERAIDSIYNQKLLPREVILVDDFSDDGTLSFLYELQRRYLSDWIKIIELPENLGAASARNLGWEVATQDYIAFLDSDDSWHPEKISIQYSFMKENPNLSLTGHSCEVMSTDGFEPQLRYSTFSDINKWKLLFSNRFLTPSVMLKRSLSQRFPENKRFSEDYHLWLNIVFAGGKCAVSSNQLTYLYKANYGESGLSSHMWKMQKGEIDNYKELYRKGDINLILFLTVFVFSYLKYTRRLKKIHFSFK